MMMHQERLNITRQDRVALEQKAAQTREQVRLLKEQTKAWAAKNAKFLGENALAQRQVRARRQFRFFLGRDLQMAASTVQLLCSTSSSTRS